MKQSRGTSLLKSLVSTGVGFGVAMVANAVVLPFFGYSPTLSENLALTSIYTVISIARGYLLERLFEALGWRMRMSPFALAVLAERQRQIDVEGWSADHDDYQHLIGDLAMAGATYAAHARAHLDPHPIKNAGYSHLLWPWSKEWWKPTGFRRDLVKAGALIIADGEKFDRSRKQQKSWKQPGAWDHPRPPGAPPSGNVVAPAAWRGHLAHGKTPSEQGGASS